MNTSKQEREEDAQIAQTEVLSLERKIEVLEVALIGLEKDEQIYGSNHSEDKLAYEIRIEKSKDSLTYWQAELAKAQAMPDDEQDTVAFLKEAMENLDVTNRIYESGLRGDSATLEIDFDNTPVALHIYTDGTYKISGFSYTFTDGLKIGTFTKVLTLIGGIALKWQAKVEAQKEVS